jgi:fatty-acyl-CoA synthase
MTAAPTITVRFIRRLPDLIRGGPSGRFTVGDLLERLVRRHCHATFVRFEDQAWSYAEINALANRVAHWGQGHGLQQGSVVGLLMENRPEYLAMWLGLAKLGIVTALLNTHLRGEALAHSLRAADCKIVLLGEENEEAWSSLSSGAIDAEVFRVGNFRQPRQESITAADCLGHQLVQFSDANPPRSLRAELRGGDPLFYIYTSGTTGLPKAARLSHSRFMGGGIYASLAGLTSADVFYCPLPLYHTSGGVMCVNAVMARGATLALARHFSAHLFWDDVAKYRATAFQYIGELCRYLVNQPVHPLERDNHLRMAVGNGIRPDIWTTFQDRFGVEQIVEFYGATESNVSMVNLRGRVGSVGKPFPGMKTALVRYDLEVNDVVRGPDGLCIPCKCNEPGELLGYIAQGRSAAGRFEGYTSKEATRQKILRDVLREGDAWFRSGDLLSRDEDGFYYFVDRIGDTFRWKGENVSTQEVAGALNTLAEIHLCAVFGVAVPGADGKAGMAAIVLEPEASLDGEVLFHALEGALPNYARPAFVRIQQQADVTGTFKLRKVELQEQAYDLAACPDPILYRDETERAYRPLDNKTAARIQRGDIRF